MQLNVLDDSTYSSGSERLKKETKSFVSTKDYTSILYAGRKEEL